MHVRQIIDVVHNVRTVKHHSVPVIKEDVLPDTHVKQEISVVQVKGDLYIQYMYSNSGDKLINNYLSE